jgi:hypothetical protein
MKILNYCEKAVGKMSLIIKFRTKCTDWLRKRGDEHQEIHVPLY